MKFRISTIISLAVLLALLALSTPLVAVQQGKTTQQIVAECDRLAASPWDPERKGEGVGIKNIDSAAAIEACRQAVRLNATPRLQFQYGRSLATIEENEEQNREAVMWYRKAAEQGHALAQYLLGWMYANGSGVAKNAEMAAQSLKEAEQYLAILYIRNVSCLSCGPIEPRQTFANIYTTIEEKEEQNREAVMWYRKAAEQGLANAQLELDRILDLGYHQTTVFFATDREMSQSKKDGIRFTGARSGGELVYGRVMVSIPFSHKIGEIESPGWWRLWNRDDPSDFVVVLSIQPLSGASAFTTDIGAFLGEAGHDDILVFVHGYNVTFNEAAKRTAQLAYDMDFKGAPLFYAWPSRGGFDKYPADVENIEWTQPHFEEFLRLVMTETGGRTVHVIAHSMGARLLVRTLSDFDPRSLPSGSATLKQIVLAAPDIDVSLFRRLAAEFPGKAERVTLYISRKDKALLMSEQFNDQPRAGNSIVIVDGVDTIDASEAETRFLAHAYFGSSIIRDVFDVIRSALAPSDRFGLKAVSTPEGLYWEVMPGAFTR